MYQFPQKCSLGVHKRLYKNIKNLTNPNLLNGIKTNSSFVVDNDNYLIKDEGLIYQKYFLV